jgi:hypothetical protein
MNTGIGMTILGFIILIVVAVIAIGWIIPLIIGLVRLRKKKSGGLALTIIGGVWGAVAIVIIAIGVYSVFQARRYMQVEEFNPATYKGSTGKIVMSYKGDSMLTVMTMNNPKRLRLTAKDGVALAPVGSYTPLQFEAELADKDGNEWAASSTLVAKDPNQISVQPDISCEIKVGPPLKASVSIDKGGNKDDEYFLSLELTGVDGGSYSVRKLGKDDWAPGFEFIDSAGKVVWQGKFEYG